MDTLDRTFVLSLATADGGQRLEPKAILPKGRFEDLDEDGILEYLLEDETYQYRLGGIYGGPRPTVVFVPDGRGDWRFDPEMSMGRPMPEDWQEKLATETVRISRAGPIRQFPGARFGTGTSLSGTKSGVDAVSGT